MNSIYSISKLNAYNFLDKNDINFNQKYSIKFCYSIAFRIINIVS